MGLICFIAMILLVGYKMIKNKERDYGNIISITILIFLLVGQMDYYNEKYLQFILWVLAYNIDVFKINNKKSEESGI